MDEESLETEEATSNENIDIAKDREERVMPDDEQIPEGIENTAQSDQGMEKEGEDLETGDSENPNKKV